MPLRNLILVCALSLGLAACSSPEEKAERYYENGLALLAEGDQARALVEFKNALVQVGSHLGARRELAQIRLAEGNEGAAFREFSRVIEQDPDDLETLIILSELAFVAQAWEAFERHSAAAIALAPEDPEVQIIALARDYREAAMDQDGPARAALLERAEALKPEAPDSSMLRQVLIDGYLSQERYGAALEVVEEAIAADPDFQPYYQAKLQIMRQLQDEEGFEQTLYDMVDAFPGEENFKANLLRFLIGRGKLDAAESYLRERVETAGRNDQEPRISLVQFLTSIGRREAALAELDAALKDSPDNDRLRGLRASLNFDAGNRAEGIAEMEAILEDHERPLPRDLQRIKVTLANMLLIDGNEVGARRLVEDVLSEDPSLVEALKMQARWMIEEDDTEGAVNAMRTALAESARDFEAMGIMAAAYQRSGQTELMMDFLSQAAAASNNAPEQSVRLANALLAQDKVGQAESTLIASLRNHPENLQVLEFLSRIYLRQDDRERARQVLESLRRLDSEQARQIATQLELALMSRNEGNQKALEYLETLIAEDDENSGLKATLIRAKLQSGEIQEALSMVEDLIASDPDNVSYAYFHGLVLMAADDPEQAREVFEDVVAREPKAIRAWAQLAGLSSATQDFVATREILDRGLEANPGAETLLWAKASLLEQQGEIDGAIEIYEGLYAENSASPIVANNLASLLSTFRQDDESLERAATIARRLRNTDVPAFQDTYGWILMRQGSAEEALKYLEPAAAGLSADPWVQFHLGVTYQALGRTEEAREQFIKAQELIGEQPVRDLRDRIGERLAQLEEVRD